MFVNVYYENVCIHIVWINKAWYWVYINMSISIIGYWDVRWSTHWQRNNHDYIIIMRRGIVVLTSVSLVKVKITEPNRRDKI